VDDNELNEILYSASATGAGRDEITDFNNDGKIDGYIKNRWSYDVLYYPVKRIYGYNEEEFVLVKTEVDMLEYPTGPEEVVKEYVALNVLEFQKSEEVESRLDKLCSKDVKGVIDFSYEQLFEFLKLDKMGLGSDLCC
jgi:hypothetical protein